MQVLANGAAREAEEGWTVEDFVRAQGLDPRFVIVEHNGEPVERKRFSQTPVADGDRLELVRAVAGG